MESSNVQENEKNIFKLLWNICTVLIPSLIAYLSFFKKDSSIFNHIKEYNNLILIISLVLLLCGIIYISRRILKKMLKNRGVEGIPIKFNLFIKRYNPFINLTYCKKVHRFQHSISFANKEVQSNQEITPWNDNAKKRTKELLKECQNILKTIIGVDFSLNIKLFVTNENYSGETDIDKTLLKTYVRVPTTVEENDNDSERNNDEKFSITIWTNNDENLFKKIDHAILNSKNNIKKNYAYDYVFGPTKHYWLSNNLIEDEKNDKFISSSSNWKNFYKSLGVFIISPPLKKGTAINNCGSEIIGLLIIDSLETNIFSEKYIKYIIGYFSHRFFDYFREYQKNCKNQSDWGKIKSEKSEQNVQNKRYIIKSKYYGK